MERTKEFDIKQQLNWTKSMVVCLKLFMASTYAVFFS